MPAAAAANMRPPATAIDAIVQDVTDQRETDNVSESIDEGAHIQEIDNQVPPPLKNKKRHTHKPMNAAEQEITIARIKEQLKQFEGVDAAVRPPVATTEATAMEMDEPVAKKRKLSDHMLSPEMTPTAVPTESATPSPKESRRSRRRSSNASTSTAHDDPYVPQGVKELMDKFSRFGTGMERALSGITARASKMSLGEDTDAIRARLHELEKGWKLSNREHMRKMVGFMERNGIVAFGEMEAPSASLGVVAQSEGGSSSNE